MGNRIRMKPLQRRLTRAQRLRRLNRIQRRIRLRLQGTVIPAQLAREFDEGEEA